MGESIAAIAKPREWMKLMVLADYNIQRAEEVQKKLGDATRFPVESIDASKQENIEALAKKYNVDLIMNAVDPVFNKQIFDAADFVKFIPEEKSKINRLPNGFLTSRKN